MSSKISSGEVLNRWITAGSMVVALSGVGLIISSRTIDDSFWRDVILGFGLALAPSGVIGFLADWLVFGKLIEALRTSTSNLGDKTNSLEKEINSLRVSTDFLKQSSELGLEMIYPDRGMALRGFVSAMHNESQRKASKANLIIVGSSIKGLTETIKNTLDIIRDSVENECDLRILLTHPAYSTYRENQEDRPTGAIEDEIFDSIRKLESCIAVPYPEPPDKKFADVVKLYKGTPTCFMIIAGNSMLINPYPYEEEAYKSFCLVVRRIEPGSSTSDTERTIYSQYRRAHFEKPWERNSVPYRHYWLEGPDSDSAWDRETCYGDVFIVQDASQFYLAVYLQGQSKAPVRGMPTSICYSKSSDCIPLPNEFSVRLFNDKDNRWHHLEDELIADKSHFGKLKLHEVRRRGKVSGMVNGNLLNDYIMIGLFDPEDKVVNPHNNISNKEGLKEQPLPLFYVWLKDRTTMKPNAEAAINK